MNKTAIKNVATFARKELINQVALRAQSFGITPESPGEVEVGSDYVIINGQHYPKSFQEPFKALQREIEKKGFHQVVEEVAYTWFNRFVALRFMEVNEYLPSKIRVLSSQTPGKVDPDILTMYREVDFPYDEAYVQKRLIATTRRRWPRCGWTTCRKCRSSMPTKSSCSCSAWNSRT